MFKKYNTLHSCHNFPAGSRQAARCARICETSLLSLVIIRVVALPVFQDAYTVTVLMA